jgi:hypothetical protein
VLRLAPPFIVSEAESAAALEILRGVLIDAVGELAPSGTVS